MIIELFGPPGVGKTTLASALAARLRARGHGFRLWLSYRPSEYPLASYGEGVRCLIPAALYRLIRPMVDGLVAARQPSGPDETRAAEELMRLLVPRSFVWSLRLRQYLLRLSRAWRDAALAGDITLFDQGFVQAVHTLVLLARVVDQERIWRALDRLPEPDLLVRIDAPLPIIAARLTGRRRRQGRIERLLDFDVETNLGSVWIFDQIHQLLQARGQHVICVDSANQQSLCDGVDKVETITLGIQANVLARSGAELNEAG